MPHSRSLLRVACRLTFCVSAGEDLVQETLLAAWKHFDQFEPGTNIRAWLFRILMNRFHDRNRKLRIELPPVERSYETRFDETMEVTRALAALDVDQRTVLLLGAVEGFTSREISNILSIPIGTVMSRMSRARDAMRTRLEARVAQPA
jgi:RNA polymerase sigma-70 factor (ECF subfamily)